MFRATEMRIFILFCLLISSKAQAILCEEDLMTISRYFCLENPLFLRPLSGGIDNTPVYVFTKKNGEEIPFGVFKKEKQNERFVINRFLFLEEIKNRGFQELPKIIKNINGEYLTNVNGEKYSCFEYLEPDSQEEEVSFSFMLELIGRFHGAALHLPNAKILNARMLDVLKKRKHFFLDPRLKEVDPSLFGTPLWEQVIALSDFYISPEFEEIYNSLPMQIIHGDTHLGNIVKSKNQFYLIDFDLMRYDIRLWDLVSCIAFSFFDEFLEKAKNGSFSSFIESYYELGGIKLENCEKKYLYEIVKFRKVEVMSLFLEMMHAGIVNQNEAQFKQFREILMKEMADVEQLLTQIPQASVRYPIFQAKA